MAESPIWHVIGDTGRGLPSLNGAVTITLDNGHNPRRLSPVVCPLVFTIGGKGAILLENMRAIMDILAYHYQYQKAVDGGMAPLY